MKSKISTAIKLAGLWTTLMLLYIYCDIYATFRTGFLEEAMAGKMGSFEVSQLSLALAGALMIIPALMITANLFLKQKAAKWANIIISGLYTLVNIGNLMSEAWTYYWLYGLCEIFVTAMIIIVATKWKEDATNG